ncbi:MAG: hypothetical protein ACRD0J_08575, partial [Acidimicrobiales bacterium]
MIDEARLATALRQLGDRLPVPEGGRRAILDQAGVPPSAANGAAGAHPAGGLLGAEPRRLRADAPGA